MKGERELISIYASAGDLLRERLRRIDPLDIKTAEADDLRAFARRLVRVLDERVIEWAETYLRAAYDIGAKRAEALLKSFGKRPVKSGVSDERTNLIADTIAVLADANRSIPRIIDRVVDLATEATRTVRYTQVQEFEDDDDYFEGGFTAGAGAGARGAIADAAAKAVAQGASRGRLQAIIRDILANIETVDGFIEIVGKDGVARMYNARKYAKMVARTELRKAQTEATKEKAREYGHDLVQVSDHDGCPDCEEWEGNIYSLSGAHPVYEQLTNEPPFHPNCLHSLLPTSEAEIKVRGDEGWERPF